MRGKFDISNELSVKTKIMEQQTDKLDFTGTDIFLGIDAHLKSWKVSIMINGIICKVHSQNSKAKDLANHLQENYPGGNYYSAYEAGFCGFSSHRDLQAHGINNIVVNPADVPTTDKEKKHKDDVRDSRKIVRALYNKELQAIYIPSMEIEGLRSLVRYRKTLVKEISRYKYRTKSLLYYYGIKLPIELEPPSRHWSIAYSVWLKSLELESVYSRMTLDSIIDTVTHLRAKLLEVTKQLRSLEKQGQYADTIALL